MKYYVCQNRHQLLVKLVCIPVSVQILETTLVFAIIKLYYNTSRETGHMNDSLHNV